MTETQENKVEIPAKFLDEAGELKTEELVKSYLELEKKMSAGKAKSERPASAKEYQLNIKNPLITVDEEINQILFDHGFTNDQAQVVYDLATDKVLPMIQSMVEDIAANKELQSLEEEFGGAEQFNTAARQISAWGEKNLSPKTFEALCQTKDGIMTIYQMMQGKMESPLVQGKGRFVPQDDEQALKKLMQDPKYWRDQDPELLKRVEAGFKRLYG